MNSIIKIIMGSYFIFNLIFRLSGEIFREKEREARCNSAVLESQTLLCLRGSRREKGVTDSGEDFGFSLNELGL